jgi:hypothetical protein
MKNPILSPPAFISYLPIYSLENLSDPNPMKMVCTPGCMRKKLLRPGFTSANVRTRGFLALNTPAFLTGFVITAGGVLEKIPFICLVSQSLFINANHFNRINYAK